MHQNVGIIHLRHISVPFLWTRGIQKKKSYLLSKDNKKGNLQKKKKVSPFPSNFETQPGKRHLVSRLGNNLLWFSALPSRILAQLPGLQDLPSESRFQFHESWHMFTVECLYQQFLHCKFLRFNSFFSFVFPLPFSGQGSSVSTGIKF